MVRKAYYSHVFMEPFMFALDNEHLFLCWVVDNFCLFQYTTLGIDDECTCEWFQVTTELKTVVCYAHITIPSLFSLFSLVTLLSWNS